MEYRAVWNPNKKTGWALRKSLRLVVLAISIMFISEGPTEAKVIHTSSSPWHLNIKDSSFGVTIPGIPLREVLEVLGTELSISVSIKGPVGNETVSMSFTDLSFEEGIKRILNGKEYALFHKSSINAQQSFNKSHIRQILVLSKPSPSSNASNRWVDISKTGTSPVDDYKRRVLEAPLARDRVNAFDMIVSRGKDSDITQVLSHTLRDPDSNVRRYVLEYLEDGSAPLPEYEVATIADQDEHPKLRAIALSLLAYRGSNNNVHQIKRALQDPDKDVRQTAAALLEDLQDDESEN